MFARGETVPNVGPGGAQRERAPDEPGQIPRQSPEHGRVSQALTGRSRQP